MAMVTASGEMAQFISGNSRKTKQKDTGYRLGLMETSTMENGKTTREQDKESQNYWQQEQSKDAISKMTR